MGFGCGYRHSDKAAFVQGRLREKWVGPFAISKVISKTQYILTRVSDGVSSGLWHVSALKPVIC